MPQQIGYPARFRARMAPAAISRGQHGHGGFEQGRAGRPQSPDGAGSGGAAGTGPRTSVALVEDCLARIAARDGELHAWSHVDREHALAQARARDREPRRSPLHGVPVGIKDIFDTHDMPTAYGSSIHAGHRPADRLGRGRADAPRRPGHPRQMHHHRIRKPGADRRAQSARSHAHARASRRAARRPRLPISWCRSRSARRPADRPSCRPPIAASAATRRRLTGIDRGNIRQLRPTLDTIGLLARSIADIASLHGVLERRRRLARRRPSVRRLRIGVCHTNNWQLAQPETVARARKRRKSLARGWRQGARRPNCRRCSTASRRRSA